MSRFGLQSFADALRLRRETLPLRFSQNKGAISMNSYPDSPTEIEKIWKTPTFRVIPISFEASAYALVEDDRDPLIG
jgi:hypothetical protein